MPEPHLPKGRPLQGCPGLLPHLPPPHCPNRGDDHDAFSKECRARPVAPPQPEAPPPPDEELSDAFSDSEEAMDLGDDGQQVPSTPKAPPTQTVDLSTPRPLSHSRNDHPPPPRGGGAAPPGPGGPTGPGLPPATPLNPRVRPGNDYNPLLYPTPWTGSGKLTHPRSAQQLG